MQYSMLENGMDFIISGILHLQKAESENAERKYTRQRIKNMHSCIRRLELS